MVDARKILDQLIGSNAAGGFAGGLAGGVLASALMSKKGRKLTGSAVKLGGLALVGGLAYKAWQNHKQGVAAPAGGAPAGGFSPPPVDLQAQAGFLPRPGDEAGAQQLSQLVARAMISAAKADGQIDVRESEVILAQVNALPLDDEAKAFLFAEYSKPLDIAGLVAAVDSPEHAAEVYAASVLVVHPASPAERFYLSSLAGGLGLEPSLARQIESVVASGATA
jgi:uncharacterized membrane protein YebE (DUF533 family)